MAWPALSVLLLGKENVWHLQFVRTQRTFSHSLFHTVERQCATFQTPKGVIVSPPSCGRQPAKPGTVCQLSCHEGYILAGVREELRCATSGKWSARVQTAVCKGRSSMLVRLKTKFPCNYKLVDCGTVLCNSCCKPMINGGFTKSNCNMPGNDRRHMKIRII